uniref:Uncharacterized protein n=1 Tax=Arundo donax TaxID=35708 RepID=A0A0A8ZNU7_ARUDO
MEALVLRTMNEIRSSACLFSFNSELKQIVFLTMLSGANW